MKHIGCESDRILTIHDKFRESVEKRIGDLHTFLSEVKDEGDRLSERVRGNYTEAVSFHKGLGTSLKRLRSE
jgi:hypothetical protein